HQVRENVESQRQRYPCEPQGLNQAQDKLAPVMHGDEIVKVVEVERAQAERGRQRGFIKAVHLEQLELRVSRSQTHIHGHYQPAEEQHRFDENQQNCACIESARSQLPTMTSSPFFISISVFGGRAFLSLCR